MVTRIVTVDIDNNAIRLLQVQGNRVERWATAPLEEGVVQDGAIADPQALAAQIRRLRRSSGIITGDVVASVSGLFSVARTMTFPQEHRELLFQQAREEVSGEGLRLLWQTMRANGTGEDILMLWANEQQVDAHTGALRAAGLPPRVLEFKAVALSRAVNQSEALIVNIEPSSLDIVLVAEGLPRVMRTVALPTTPSPQDRASRVVQALQHTVAYYNSLHADRPLPPQLPLFLVGPMAEDPPLRQQIEERVEFSLETFAPPLEFPPHLPAAQYAVNIGLALRQVAQQPENGQEGAPLPIRINLVPRTSSVWRLTPQRAAFLGALTLGLALAYLLLQAGASAAQEVDRLRAEVAAITQEVDLRKDDLARLTQVEASIKDFQKLTEPWGRVTGAIEMIQETLTPGIQLTSIKVTGNQAEFKAKAETVEQAIQFVEALRESGQFGDVQFPRPATDIEATLNLAALKAKE